MMIHPRNLFRRPHLAPQETKRFHSLRLSALELAKKIFDDRATGYNVDHEAVEEMVFGCASLAGELYKRATRMVGLLTPLRTSELRQEDLNRLVDLCIDIINYASWQYALLQIWTNAEGNENADDSPTYTEENDES